MAETFWGFDPFFGTSLGAACVFFMRRALGDLVQRSLAGFAAGVMVAASVWSTADPGNRTVGEVGTVRLSLRLRDFGSACCFCLHWII